MKEIATDLLLERSPLWELGTIIEIYKGIYIYTYILYTYICINMYTKNYKQNKVYFM